MELGILGPISLRLDGREQALGGPKQRALLAILALSPNARVSRDRLIDGLWGDRPPVSCEHTLDGYVSRLRKVLGADRIVRSSGGYSLRVEPGELDLDRFEEQTRQGQQELAAGDPAKAAATLGDALALWRGPALADVLAEPFAPGEARRLEERRFFCHEERIDALLAFGSGPELVPELELLVAEHPFRERLLGQLMVALYRSGRQAEALAAYRRGRGRLAGELGLEPSLPLRQLERQILEHDPALGGSRVESALRATVGRRRTTLVAALVAVGVAAAAAVVGVGLGTGGTRTPGAGLSSNALIELVGGARSAATATVLPEAPATAAVGAGSVWLAEPNAGAVLRVDEATRNVERIPVGAGPGAIAFGAGAVWVANVPGGTVLRIDPATDAITRRIGLGGARVAALAFGLGKLWIADSSDDALLALDPADDVATRPLQLDDVQPTALAIGDGSVWVADYNGGTLTRLDPRTGETLFTDPVGDGPEQIAIGRNAVWVANSLDSTVSRVDPTTGDVLAVTQVGSDPVALAATAGGIWVASEVADEVTRLDPHHPSYARKIPLDVRPTVLAAGSGRLWVGAGPEIRRRGGTVVLLSSSPFPIDPALNTYLAPFQSDGLTGDGLVTYNHTGGPAGAQLVPDLALQLPRPTQAGTVYTFQLRSGIRYTDGRPLRAGDFRRAVERLFRVGSPGTPYYSGLVGAEACSRIRCNLTRGVVTNDRVRTVSFHLVAPDPDFLNKLTYGPVTPVPPGTPWRALGWTPIPGTGPYEIAGANTHEIRYIRNPYFHEWSHAAQPDGIPDEIVMRFGLTPAQEVNAIEQGHADWTADGIPASLIPGVATKHPAQLQSYLTTEMAFLHINTTAPPFNDLRVRQALNDAVDRAAVARLYGGPLAATPTCQILPPGLLGYHRYCPYTRDPTGTAGWRAPDLATARRLVAESGTRGERITVWGHANVPVLGRPLVFYVVRLLDRLGYRARAHLIPQSAFARLSRRTLEKIQISTSDWIDNTPAGFIETWFTCNYPFDHDWFCHHSFDRAVRRAETLQAENSRAAAALWAKLDRELVNRAAAVPLVNAHQIDFVSAHVSNYQHNPIYGLVADQLQPRQPAKTAAPARG
jgi:DNA-binding SARP family transcriptional activator/ABC-type transport system substrate-binding protein